MEIDYDRHYRCMSHTPRDCWQSTDEERCLPLCNGRIYAPIKTVNKLSELRGGDGDYHQALMAWQELPKEERAKFPWSDSAVPWDNVPETEWILLTYCYRDRGRKAKT